MLERIQGWEWNQVRAITLTLDPSFPQWIDFGPERAFETIQEKKAIPALMRDLQRTAKAPIDDWIRVLEWHRNGFPHWHILVRVTKKGHYGKIGADEIRKYWSYGRIHENYFRTPNHWQRFTGYFGKQGYFEDKKGKAHQVDLPEWAKNRTTPIRRWDSKHKPSKPLALPPAPPDDAEPSETELQIADCYLVDLASIPEKPTVDPLPFADEFNALVPKVEKPEGVLVGEGDVDEEALDALCDWFTARGIALTMTEGEKLALCGHAVTVYRGPDWSDFIGVFDVPYNLFLACVPGRFRAGAGYVFDIDDIPQDWKLL